ncbi:MAG: phosphodiesterase [Alphaproteobacteria bacterium]|nr:phosphodiesterase [Alphaproteobacteria bacterium]
MAKIIVFTDLHILPEEKRIIGLNPSERLAAGIAHATKHHPDADRIVCTGDLTHRGDADSYQRLSAILDKTHIPVSLLIGNHDSRETFIDCFPDAPLDANGYVQSSLDVGGWRLVLLDTLNAPPYEFPETYCGFLCEARLAWLQDELRGAGDRPVLLFLHHPPHDIGFPGMDVIKLKNGPALYDLIGRFDCVKHLVAGHVHRTISGSHRGIPFSIFKSPCHQMPMNMDSLDVSLSVDEPAAYGILLTTPTGVIAHSEDYEIAVADVGTSHEALGVGADVA